ncbi:MAG TPA: FMN-binding protein [Chitinispirillaceae bacterium]|jgi:uncharacterized protein with FMN-binding domain|nr:FMN-binding protein [Chitinispirillaceae bacterium]
MKDKILFIVFISLLVVLAGSFVGTKLFKGSVQKNLIKLLATPVEDVDLTIVADGTYEGKFKAFPISVKVKVAVKDHKITSIEYIEHKSGNGAPAEKIQESVIEAQSLQVDAISGATYSSKAILNAISNALKKK